MLYSVGRSASFVCSFFFAFIGKKEVCACEYLSYSMLLNLHRSAVLAPLAPQEGLAGGEIPQRGAWSEGHRGQSSLVNEVVHEIVALQRPVEPMFCMRWLPGSARSAKSTSASRMATETGGGSLVRFTAVQALGAWIWPAAQRRSMHSLAERSSKNCFNSMLGPCFCQEAPAKHFRWLSESA